MKCENCNVCNLSVLKINMDGDEFILCPRCLKILKKLNQEYGEIMDVFLNVDGQTSSG